MENVLIIEWWHWVLGGLGLVLLELALPSFFVIWFGLGAASKAWSRACGWYWEITA